MIIKEKEQENTIVNRAWNILYQRLEKDGLLPEKNGYIPNNAKMEVEPVRPQFQDNHPPKPYQRLMGVAGKIAVAAALAGCLMAGFRFLLKNKLPEVVMLELVNEAYSPTLATILDDGSVVYLSELSSLKYPNRFDDDKREVILEGEAFFEIKSHAERPFIINTAVADVKVTGTSFKIKCDRNAPFLLSVREGTVQVTQKNRHEMLTANAGETVFFDSNRLFLKKNEEGFGDFFKHIHFKDESLVDVATIINTHSDSLQLKVDPSIERRITFTFVENSSLAEIAEVICLAMDLHHTQQDSIIYISK